MIRRLSTAARVALAVAVALPVVAVAASAPRAPSSGSQYRGGPPADVFLQISGRSVEIVAFDFPCGEVSGRTSLNDFRLKRTSKGYRFNADARSIVTYSDEQDENVRSHISGRFALDAKTVRGHLRVVSRRCGDTGHLRWKARRIRR